MGYCFYISCNIKLNRLEAIDRGFNVRRLFHQPVRWSAYLPYWRSGMGLCREGSEAVYTQLDEHKHGVHGGDPRVRRTWENNGTPWEWIVRTVWYGVVLRRKTTGPVTLVRKRSHLVDGVWYRKLTQQRCMITRLSMTFECQGVRLVNRSPSCFQINVLWVRLWNLDGNAWPANWLVVRCCPMTCGSQEINEFTPKVRMKLMALVRGDCQRNS